MGDRGAIRIKIRIKEIRNAEFDPPSLRTSRTRAELWRVSGRNGSRRPWPTKRGKAGEVGSAVKHGRGGARPYRNRERKQPLYSESPTGE